MTLEVVGSSMGRLTLLPAEKEDQSAERHEEQPGASSVHTGPTSAADSKEHMLEQYHSSSPLPSRTKGEIRPSSIRISRMDAQHFDDPKAALHDEYQPAPELSPRASLGTSVRPRISRDRPFPDSKANKGMERKVTSRDQLELRPQDEPAFRVQSRGKTGEPVTTASVREKSRTKAKGGLKTRNRPQASPLGRQPLGLVRPEAFQLNEPARAMDETNVDCVAKASVKVDGGPLQPVHIENRQGAAAARLNDAVLDEPGLRVTASPSPESPDEDDSPLSGDEQERTKGEPATSPLDSARGDNDMEEIQVAQEALNSFMDMLLPSSPSTNDAFSMPSVATTTFDTDENRSGSSSSSQLTQDRIALAEAALQNFMDVIQQDFERGVVAETERENQNEYPEGEEPRRPRAKIHLLDLFRWSLSPNVDAEEKLKYLEQERKRISLEKEREVRALARTDEALREQRFRLSHEAQYQRRRVHEIEEDLGLASTGSSTQTREDWEEAGLHQRTTVQNLMLLSQTRESTPTEIFHDEEDLSPEEAISSGVGLFAWVDIGGRPVITRDEHRIDPNALSQRQKGKPMPKPPAWVAIGGRPVVEIQMPLADGNDAEPNNQERSRPPHSLSSSSYSHISTDPSWGNSRQSSGSSKDQSETSSIKANALSAASASLLQNRIQSSASDPLTDSSSRLAETPTHSISQMTGSSMPSWAAFGGRPIVMSTESSEVSATDRDSPESILLPSSFHDDDGFTVGSNDSLCSFEASISRFETKSVELPVFIPDSVSKSSLPSSEETPWMRRSKSHRFFMSSNENVSRSDEKPLLNQTDIISVGSAGDIHQHVGLTIRYLDDLSQVSKASAVSLDADLKADEHAFGGGRKRSSAGNPRWTGDEKRSSIGCYVKRGLKGLRNSLPGRGRREKFKPQSKSTDARQSLLFEEEEALFDRTPILHPSMK